MYFHFQYATFSLSAALSRYYLKNIFDCKRINCPATVSVMVIKIGGSNI